MIMGLCGEVNKVIFFFKRNKRSAIGGQPVSRYISSELFAKRRKSNLEPECLFIEFQRWNFETTTTLSNEGVR